MVAAAALAAVTGVRPAVPAEPDSGTLSAAAPQVTWTGGPLLFTTFGTGCQPVAGPTCDVFDLTVDALAPTAPDIVISGAAGASADVLSLYVYDADGNLVGQDDSLTANPRVILRHPAAGAYSVRFEALLGTTGLVTYKAVAATTDAGPPPDPEVPCTGEDAGLGTPPPEVMDAALNDDGHDVRLDVLVLLDGVSEPFARDFFKTVAIPYEDLKIKVAPTFRTVAPGAIRSDVTGEIIEQAKDLLPGRKVPPEFDVVELLTHRDIEALGQKAIAGQAECTGGVKFKEHSFNVSEGQEDANQEGRTFGPIRLVPYFAAKITAHEIGHLFGGQHHFANCVEGLHDDAVNSGDSSPCSLMFNAADFISLRFGTLNGRIVRGYALVYASKNDALSAPAAGASASAAPAPEQRPDVRGSGERLPATGGGALPLGGVVAGLVALGVRRRLR